MNQNEIVVADDTLLRLHMVSYHSHERGIITGDWDLIDEAFEEKDRYLAQLGYFRDEEGWMAPGGYYAWGRDDRYPGDGWPRLGG